MQTFPKIKIIYSSVEPLFILCVGYINAGVSLGAVFFLIVLSPPVTKESELFGVRLFFYFGKTMLKQMEVFYHFFWKVKHSFMRM